VENFDLVLLSQLIVKAQGTRTLNEYSRISGIANAYLSHLINKTAKIKSAPSPDVLRRISNSSFGTVSYIELMFAAGHLTQGDIEEYLKSR
jgi:hypothetical protein